MRIYTDESCTRSDQGPYMLIGGIICDKETSKEVRKAIQLLINNSPVAIPKDFEFHFSHIIPAQVELYKKLCDIFFDFYKIRCDYKRGVDEERTYRCICFETMLILHSKIDHYKYSKGDPELGFFQFYYTLLAHSLRKHYRLDHRFHITIDKIRTKNPQMVPSLQKRLSACCQPGVTDPISRVDPQDSKAELLLQMADVILGSVSFTWNKKGAKSSPRIDAKRAVCQHVESRLGKSLSQKTYFTESFNIWEMDMK